MDTNRSAPETESAPHGSSARRGGTARLRPSRAARGSMALLAASTLVASLATALVSAIAPARGAGAAPAAGPSPDAGIVSAILGRALGPTPVTDDLRELTDTIGGRPTGTPALDRAIAWGLAGFTSAGLDSAHTESYTARGVWVPGTETAEAIVLRRGLPEERTQLRAAAMPFGPPTSASGLEAEVVDVGSGDAAAFVALGERARGRWVLVHTEPMKGFADLFAEYLRTPPLFDAAKKSGASGVLYISNRPGKLLYRHNVTIDGTVGPLPAVLVEREGGLRLARLLEAGASVRVRAVSTGAMLADRTFRNVVAEIKGREKPEESVILGAHLDSWDLGRGALDNGANAALVIDAARTLRTVLGERAPRRTMRFVLYTGEEAGCFGSFGEVRAHRKDLDRVFTQIVFDEGTGRVSGFSLGGREDLRAAADEALAGAAGLGPFVHTADAFFGTDNYDYMVEGVPTLVANQAEAPYLPDYHAESDTFDKVDVRELKVNTAIAALVLWRLAERPGRTAPRQTRAEIEAMVKATGLDEQMKLFGLWESFMSGERGRAR